MLNIKPEASRGHWVYVWDQTSFLASAVEHHGDCLEQSCVVSQRKDSMSFQGNIKSPCPFLTEIWRVFSYSSGMVWTLNGVIYHFMADFPPHCFHILNHHYEMPAL